MEQFHSEEEGRGPNITLLTGFITMSRDPRSQLSPGSENRPRDNTAAAARSMREEMGPCCFHSLGREYDDEAGRISKINEERFDLSAGEREGERERAAWDVGVLGGKLTGSKPGN